MAEMLLYAFRRTCRLGDAVVLDDVGFDIAEKGSLAVLGRNGVGKSTLLLTIMGFTRMTRGTIHWRGADITRLAPSSARAPASAGSAQEREMFPSLTVAENLTVTARPGHWTIERVSTCCRGSTSGMATRAISFPAASSRCWHWRAR